MSPSNPPPSVRPSLNRIELHAAWNALVQSWRPIWQASDAGERWREFALHCQRLGELASACQLGALETQMAPLLDMLGSDRRYGDADKARVDQLLPAIFAAVRAALEERGRQAERSSGGEALPLVVLLAREAQSHRDLLVQMEHYGYAFKVFTQYRHGVRYALMNRAVAVVAQLDGELDAETISVVQEMNRCGLKWFALSDEGSFRLRLQAVRHDAQGFFVTPLMVNSLVDAVDPIAFESKDEPFRVLTLDDSATVLASIERILGQFPNLHVRSLRDPSRILETLMDFAPDVLLLDFHMDGCTGLEVARIIRQNKSFESIPIVYLTSETSESVQQEAMRQGGDDFLTKPISAGQLVSAVVSKAERYRGLRRLMVEDSLTGLFNHVKTKTLLQQTLLLADRQGVPVSYAILDIDHFKQVNDTYGHTTGDKVIKSLARYLRQRMRRSDVVGRYGGEEFVVVLFDSSPADALERIETLRKGFSGIFHQTEQGMFSATFSAGIAHFPAYPTMMELMVAADDALYVSKRSGRNRCSIAERSIPD
ncbi:diguanylate cyclase [Niveibacterium sp. 24ML]|uniref:GGDEF domain-containing protein n=1 Tax=Niveibacterium sp. 24ML TaxID=2985512 RepID=UPI00226DA1D8|nr:diguanylate cyclase [Niveibacterium sp. 24ML]MCX9155731.1 diguanylate cyclase [Niveibacterium sp. 24ML]